MRIVGFGDSFIWKAPYHKKAGYLDMVGLELDAEVHWNGYNGSGPWDAFFQFKDYPKEIDVAIFAWSVPSRLYHPHIRGMCHGSVQRINNDTQHPETWEAAKQYYHYLYDWRKTQYEITAFYQWFDRELANYPNTKFIHMWSFSAEREFHDGFDKYKQDPDQLEYYHRWSNGVEIRPALMYFSAQEGWPANDDLSKETRENHLSLEYHKYLAKILVDNIKNYESGKLYASK